MLFDTGETEFIQPILKRLDSNKFKLMTFGTSETLGIISDYPQLKSSEIGLSETISKDWPREKLLSPQDLEVVTGLASKFKVVISGVASILQGQILSSITSSTLIIWDNFKGNDTGFYWEIASKVQFSANSIIFPSRSTYNGLISKPPNYHIIGHPSLEDWASKVILIDKDQAKQKLNIFKKVILYVAGWSGDPECHEGTRLFAKICRNHLKNYNEEYSIIVQLHPRSDGEFERQEFDGTATVSSRAICTTEEATAIADIVICHKTTAGPKIAAAGKKIMFLVPQEGYSNQLIETGKFFLARSEEEFGEMFEKTLRAENNEDIFQIFDMPQNSVDLFLELIEREALENSETLIDSS